MKQLEAKIKYEFSAKMWQHNAPGGWHFISLPKTISKEIREHLKWQEEGWGRMKAQAQIKKLEWDTAIWYDAKMGAYLLPVKAEVRYKTGITIDQEIHVILRV